MSPEDQKAGGPNRHAHTFAPGVIERHTPSQRTRLNTAIRCALFIVAFGLFLAHLSGAFHP